MWQKLIGAGLVLACGGLWAEGRSRADRAELARIAAFGTLFARFREQIEGLCLPLDEILAGTPPDLLAACGCEGKGTTVAALLCAMRQVEEGQAAEVLRRAAAELGRGSREDQVRLCRATAEALTACRERLAAEVEKNARARGTLVLTASLGGIILLW